MKLNEKAIALASGITLALISAVCSIFVALFPDGMARLASFWAHMDFTDIVRSVTAANFIGGVALSFVLGAVVAWIGASIYNRLAGKK